MNWFYRFAYVLAWPFIRLFCPFRLVGLEKLPEGGAVLCANHSNAMDPILIALSLPRDVNMVIMAKDQLFRIPLLGPILRALGAFPVKRGLSDMAAIKTAMKSLMEGRRLLVFPRGPGWSVRATRMPRAAPPCWPSAPACPWCPFTAAAGTSCFTVPPSSSETPTYPRSPAARPTPGGESPGRGGDHAPGLRYERGERVEVIQAKSAGFCFGVARAVEMARALAESGRSAKMLGEVIHNRTVIDALEARGMTAIESPLEAQPGDAVLLRAHGVGRGVYDQLRARGADVVDAACPKVRRVQELVQEAEREGRQPVMIGDPRHPEVLGVGGWCRRLLVFSGPEEVDAWLSTLPNPAEIPLTVVGSDHPHPGGLGKIFGKSKKTVYKRENI